MLLRPVFLVLASTLASAAAPTSITYDDPPLRVPFHVGERLIYGAKVNFLNAGSATMDVMAIEHVRGVPVFHTVFDIKGKVFVKKVENHYESWFDTTTLTSLKHVQRVSDGENQNKEYEFYPEKRVYVRNGETKASVAQPLDEGSIIYYLRSLPLEPGKTYTIARYYNAERNPIVVKVVRREKIKVPAGEFDAILVQPVVKSRGLFGEEAKADVWLAATGDRPLLKLKSKLPVGTLYLELKSIQRDP